MKKLLFFSLFISFEIFGQTPKMEVVAGTTENVEGIKATLKNTTPASYIAGAIIGLNKSTTTGNGVYGGHDGTGIGVYGWSKNGHGVYGFSQFSTGGSGVYGLVYGADRSGVRGYSENGYGNGILGEAESGIGVKGYAQNAYSGTGIGGHFSNASSSGYALVTGTGKLKFAGPGVGTLGTDKFLKSINTNGDAEWSDLLPLSIAKSNNYALLNVSNLNTGAFNGAEFTTYSSTSGSGIVGKALNPNPTLESKGIRGENHSTNSNGYGVFGEHYGYGTAIYGLSAAGKGVHGYSGEGIGGYFTSTTGYALITETGKVGIGVTPNLNSDERMDLNDRLRIRHSTSTAGVWFNNSANSINYLNGAFHGMISDTQTGIFIGGGWRFWVNNIGDMNVVGEVNRSQTSNANMVPIAYGSVSSIGGLYAGNTGNLTISKTGTGNYEITIAGENYYYETYLTVATLNEFGFVKTNSFNTKLLVNTANTAGTATDLPFSFVVYKK